ncbi:MAG: DUF6152 family protein [Sphingobium sp.]
MIGAAILLCLGGASSSFAHHSFAMFDIKKKMVIDGVVSRYFWTNPHVFISLDTQTKAGKTERYAIEAASISILSRHGWKVSSIKVGQRIRATFNPLKNGEKGGLLIQVQRPDGSILKQ